MSATTTVSMMDLPIEMIDKILSYLSYDQIAKVRPVNRTFNNICSDKLNNGFIALEKFHTKCMKAVKTKLPRRESERKHHPLARHCDILMAVETRLSMLSMTFTKYIEMRHCCFIPGKVLDEAFRVLRIVNNCSSPSSTNLQYPNLPRPYEFLQEYRDISSMAMEHFDDKILPSIREKMRLENPRLYSYKNKLSRPQLLGVHAVKVTMLQSNGELEKCTTPGPDATAESSKNASTNKAVTNPAQKLFKFLRNTDAKCNSARKAVVELHRNVKIVSNKLIMENIMLKRKCNKLRSVITLLRRELAETKSAMSALAKDLNQLKTEHSSSSAESSRSDHLATNPAMKLYKLLRHTDAKCNSTRKAVVSVHRTMKIMSKKIRVQDSLLKQRYRYKKSTVMQKRLDVNNSRTLPSTSLSQSYTEPSCSRGVKRKLMASEENDNQI